MPLDPASDSEGPHYMALTFTTTPEAIEETSQFNVHECRYLWKRPSLWDEGLHNDTGTHYS